MTRMADEVIQCVQKIATDLRPAVLDSLGLCAAVEWQTRDFQKHAGIPCRASVPEKDISVGHDTATAVFRILQESLTNVQRHANATRVDIVLRKEAGQLLLRIRDNGCGIPAEALNSPMSFGLTGMRERALLLGGQFEVWSQAESGTTIEVRMPLPKNDTLQVMGKIRILLSDDHQIVRKALMQLLSDEFTDAEFCEASTPAETLECLARQPCDLLVLDIFMPGRSGLEVLDEVRRQYPVLPVLILSSAPEEQMAVRVLKAGASGYLNKQAAPEKLVKAVGKLLAGGRYVNPALLERLAGEIGGAEQSPQEALSNREYIVMRKLIAGRSIKEIGAELSLSPKTVSTYHTRIWRKLRVNNDTEMIRYAQTHGIEEEG
jgi:DNA-binding NarL/FixJ family response regulator